MSIFSSGATLALRPRLHCFVRFRERHPQRHFVGTICRDDGNFTFGKFQRSAFPDSLLPPDNCYFHYSSLSQQFLATSLEVFQGQVKTRLSDGVFGSHSRDSTASDTSACIPQWKGERRILPRTLVSSRSISSRVLPFVSGTRRYTKKSPARQTPA